MRRTRCGSTAMRSRAFAPPSPLVRTSRFTAASTICSTPIMRLPSITAPMAARPMAACGRASDEGAERRRAQGEDEEEPGGAGEEGSGEEEIGRAAGREKGGQYG